MADDQPQQQIAEVCDEWHNLYAQEDKLKTETQKPHAFTKFSRFESDRLSIVMVTKYVTTCMVFLSHMHSQITYSELNCATGIG